MNKTCPGTDIRIKINADFAHGTVNINGKLYGISQIFQLLLIKFIRKMCYEPPLINALHGGSQILVCGGMMPLIVLWCNIVEIRLA